MFLQQYIQGCMSRSGNVDILQRNRKMILLSARTIWLLVQRDDDKWILLWSSRSHFSLPHRHGSSLLEDGMEFSTHLNFLEELLVFRLVPDGLGLRWMFSDAVLTQRFWLFHLRLGIWSFHFFCDVNTSFALSLLAWSSDASICSNSSMSETIMSLFNIHPAHNTSARNIPGKTFERNWCSGWYSTSAQTVPLVR